MRSEALELIAAADATEKAIAAADKITVLARHAFIAAMARCKVVEERIATEKAIAAADKITVLARHAFIAAMARCKVVEECTIECIEAEAAVRAAQETLALKRKRLKDCASIADSAGSSKKKTKLV